jgi:lysophospholipid acyltransferase
MFFEYGEWSVDDPTIIYMMSIAKFSSLAFSYEDGEIDPKLLKNNHHREYRIEEKPTLLEVLSFIYFYPTSLVGPSIEYKDFINFINEADCYSNLKDNFIYLFKHSILYFLGSFVSMAFYSIMANKMPFERTGEKEFGEHSLLYQLVYIYLSFPGVRARYYSGWLLSYSSLIISGISYTEKTDKDGKIIKSLEKGSYGSIIKVEWDSIYPKEAINEWNKTIHLWLKYNILTRVINIENKIFKQNMSLANLITFICSAIWHGFYLTYYTTFFVLYIYQTACSVLEKKGLYAWIRKTKYLIPFASIFNSLAIDSIAVMFINLKWDRALIGLKNCRYFPLIVNFGLYIITRFIKVTKKQEIEAKKIEVKGKEKKVE